MLLLPGVVANVEKAIFTGPAPAYVTAAILTLADFNLRSLDPESSAIRTNLSRAFPSDPQPRGADAWFLLDRLAEGQRYEVRVCWAAVVSQLSTSRSWRCSPSHARCKTQDPTSFSLDVYEPKAVWATPELMQSLTGYASASPADPVTGETKPGARQSSPRKEEQSLLLLRVQAAANYFTDDFGLMTHPPPVLVDLILDPFLCNVMPASLVPSAGYLVVVGVVTWLLARWIASSLQSVAKPPTRHAKTRD